MLTDRFSARLLRAPDGADAGAALPADPPPATPPANWWEGLDADTTSFVTAKGLNGKPADEALRATLGMYRNAETALGKKGIPAPDKGQDPSVWLAANREALGLPADVAGYDVPPPEGFAPELWDADLATKAAALAHEAGVPPSAHKRYVELFVARQQEMDQLAEQARTKANADMMTALERDFGKETPARLAAAQQAAQRIAEQAGVDKDGLSLIGEALADKVGLAPVIRMFDQIARMMADDTLPMGGAGGGASDVASAQTQLAALLAPDGEHGKAVAEALKTGNRTALNAVQPRVDALRRKIAGGA